MTPFDVINDLSFGKKDIFHSDKDAEKAFNPYLTNRQFSLFMDTVLFANEMNRLYDLPYPAQHDFYLHGLAKKKRFKKWPKKVDNELLDMICNKYDCNRMIAKQYVDLLTNEQLELLKQEQEKGGLKK